MRRPSEFSTEEIGKMPREEMELYSKEVEASLLTIEEQRKKIITDKHEISLKLKTRTIEYLDFQKKAYDMILENEKLKKEASALRTELLQFKRDWAFVHNTNQVSDNLETLRVMENLKKMEGVQ
jgi:hypothetical protein